MSAVLNWARANIYTVIFVAVMIVAPIALWVVSGRMNTGVRKDVEKRASKISELDRIGKTVVRLDNPVSGNDPVNATVVVNRMLLDRYREVAGKIREDADRIREKALEVNRKGRDVLLGTLFPEPAPYELETLPVDMCLALRTAYEQLLAEVRAGTPPSPESMRESLDAADARFRTQILMKEARADLTEEEEAWLAEQLTKTRLAEYAEAADQISMYASLDDLVVPDESEAPARAEGDGNVQMFEWQWDVWVVQDILRALSEANEPYVSVVEAPVKRVESLIVLDPPSGAAGSSVETGGGAPSGAFGSAGRGGRRGKQKSSGKSAVAAANPSREVPRDFNVSFTGRKTNPLYDVRRVDLVIIADSAKISEVFDALARQNFMTIVDATVDAVDLYESVRGGFFYGGSAVSRLTLQIETVWLREWTSQFMPAELKQALGIPDQPKKSG